MKKGVVEGTTSFNSASEGTRTGVFSVFKAVRAQFLQIDKGRPFSWSFSLKLLASVKWMHLTTAAAVVGSALGIL